MTSTTQNTTAEVVAGRMDRIPRLTSYHRKVLALLVALFIFDYMDLVSFVYVAPTLRKEWGLSIDQLGLLTSCVFIGMLLGGLVGGRLADRFGRKPVMLLSVGVFSLGSLGSALATGPEMFAATRILTGIGLTAATGVILVLVTELFPKSHRGRVMALVNGLASLGIVLIAVIALVVVPLGAWRVVFVVGALGIVMVPIAFKLLPESPRWLASVGRFDDAERGIDAFESAYRAQHTEKLPEPVLDSYVPVAKKSSLTELFRPTLLPRTVLATVIFGLFVLLNYGLNQWLPVILVERGYPQSQALGITLALTVGQIIGTLVSSFFIDRFERKTTIAVCAGVMTVCYLLIGFVDSLPLLLVCGFLANIFLAFVVVGIFTFVPEIFPVSVRGAGAGVANGVGRLAGVFSSIIIAAVIIGFGTSGVFIYLALVAAILVGCALLGPRVGVQRKSAPSLEKARELDETSA
jgi:putative MFS transporter